MGVRINIPLLPVLIDVRWRPLRPIPFRVWGMMLAVGVAGLVFSLGAYALRLVELGNHHLYMSLYKTTGVNSDWHTMMAQQYHHAGWILSRTFWVILMILSAIGMATALGRMIDSLLRRWAMPSQE